MLALCLMLSVIHGYYAQQYAGIIGGSLVLYLVYAWACTG